MNNYMQHAIELLADAQCDGETELRAGVWLAAGDYMSIQQKTWPDCDAFKRFDFSAALYWAWAIDSEADPVAIHDAADLAEFLAEINE